MNQGVTDDFDFIDGRLVPLLDLQDQVGNQKGNQVVDRLSAKKIGQDERWDMKAKVAFARAPILNPFRDPWVNHGAFWVG